MFPNHAFGLKSNAQNGFSEILKDADLTQMTSKKVRIELEKQFDCKLVSRKAEIDKMVVDFINDNEKDEEEDEEEEEKDEPAPKKKKKKAESSEEESEEEISSDEDKPRKRRAAAASAKKAPKKKADGRGKGNDILVY